MTHTIVPDQSTREGSADGSRTSEDEGPKSFDHIAFGPAGNRSNETAVKCINWCNKKGKIGKKGIPRKNREGPIIFDLFLDAITSPDDNITGNRQTIINYLATDN